MKFFLRKWKSVFVFAGMLSCVINLLQLTFSFYMFAIYGAIVQSYSYSSLYSITIIAVFALCFLAFFSYLRGKVLRTVSVGLDKSLSQDVMRFTIAGASGPMKQSYQQGLSDLSTVRSFMSSDALYAIFDIPWAPFYLILIFFFHPMLGTLAFGGALLTLGLTVLQDRLTRDKLMKANGLAVQNRRYMDTMLKNAEVINAMGMGRSVFSKFDDKNVETVCNQTLASRYAGATQSSIKSIQIFMNVLIYGGGAWLVLTEGFDPGLMIAASIMMGQAISPFMRAVSSAKAIIQAREAFRRLRSLFAYLENTPCKMSLPAPLGGLQAEKVVFAVGGQVLLRGVSLELKPGEFLGLIGPNGAGKSTLARVLLGVWPPVAGFVRLDGADIFRWDKEELGRFLGYLPQEIELFSATVAENIARLGDVDMDEVHRVCDLLGIRHMIESLPEGFASVVGGEGGVTFSGGEKQRIGLARAFYGSPRLLVLDEPNSNLDEIGEQYLVDALHAIRRETGATCVVITHKMTLLEAADKLLVLQNGQVAHYGARQEVLAALANANLPVQQGPAGPAQPAALSATS